MKIYLAGPMRGYPDNNAAAFAAAAADLRSRGHEVWSPAEADGGLVEFDTPAQKQAIFRRDLDALLQQDAIALLDGWNRSHGAALERHAADVCGMSVFLYAPRSEGGLVQLSPHDWRWRAGSDR